MPSDQASFRVLKFSEATLFDALSSDQCTAEEVSRLDRAKYLHRYLSACEGVNTKTIVVEENYIDGDYLEDFASYYVRCFHPYQRRCKRLHFFAESFSDDEFRAAIVGPPSGELASRLVSSYGGFVVARPLPAALVGRTVLKTYDRAGKRRNYTVVAEYSANLFGLPLTVTGLPYQEQDTVLAACATVALWSAFHKTKDLFGTPAPRPAEITRLASGVLHSPRPFPSHGLTHLQMAHAIRTVGLEAEVVPALPHVPLVSLAYAHLRMGLPVVLGVDLEGGGKHALTLTGYSIQPHRVRSQEVASGESAVPMTGLRIDEFYAHDDQIGPHSRLCIKPSVGPHPVQFEGSWRDQKTGQLLKLSPTLVIVPVYNKIRVTFIDVLKWVERFHGLFPLAVPSPEDHEWDVYLTTVNDLKKELRAGPGAGLRERLLFMPQPRFVWRARLAVRGEMVFEFLVDATDMERSFPVYQAMWHNDAFRLEVQRLLSLPQVAPLIRDVLEPRFYDFLLRSASGTHDVAGT